MTKVGTAKPVPTHNICPISLSECTVFTQTHTLCNPNINTLKKKKWQNITTSTKSTIQSILTKALHTSFTIQSYMYVHYRACNANNQKTKANKVPFTHAPAFHPKQVRALHQDFFLFSFSDNNVVDLEGQREAEKPQSMQSTLPDTGHIQALLRFPWEKNRVVHEATPI